VNRIRKGQFEDEAIKSLYTLFSFEKLYSTLRAVAQGTSKPVVNFSDESLNRSYFHSACISLEWQTSEEQIHYSILQEMGLINCRDNLHLGDVYELTPRGEEFCKKLGIAYKQR
jgi:hypothetical protein